MSAFDIISTAVLLVLGYVVGTRIRERRHFASLAAREEEFRDMLATNLKTVPGPETAARSFLVIGEAVIATDFFKSFVASLKNLVGGELRTYETLLDRARREATLRMLKEARRHGASEVWNIRYHTSNVLSASRRNAGVSVEVIASGTAVVRR